MEYNYTKEWKQPHKVYKVGAVNFARFFPEGIKLSYFVFTIVVVIAFLILMFLTAVKGITFLSNLFAKSWIVIIFFLGVLVWILFSLTWDKKNFFRYAIGRMKYGRYRGIKFEHEDVVLYEEQTISYQKKR